MIITTLEQSHYPSVKEIYEMGIATGNATFETQALAWEEWHKNHLVKCRLVAVDENENVVGWAALSSISSRCVYAGVAELSVYVHQRHQGKGIGKKLVEALIRESEKENIWTLQAGIFPENKASLRIHEQCGFRKVGHHEKIGKMKNIWRDTILLERRSPNVGVS